jgi:hypothetical protein
MPKRQCVGLANPSGRRFYMRKFQQTSERFSPQGLVSRRINCVIENNHVASLLLTYTAASGSSAERSSEPPLRLGGHQKKRLPMKLFPRPWRARSPAQHR